LVFAQKFTMQVGSELQACLLGKLGVSGPIYIARQLNHAEEKVQSRAAWILHFLEKGSVQERAMLANRMAGGS